MAAEPLPSMTPAKIEVSTLLAYVGEESANWERYFRGNPAALEQKLELAQAGNVQGVLYHIFAVEQRYAERLNQEPTTPFQETPLAVNELFEIGTKARARLMTFANEAGPEKLARTFTFTSAVAGEITTTFGKCLVHAILHSIRHWAQLASELRRLGYKQDWQHDFLFSKVMQ